MDVVVVESPTKAKTINKYLGDGYKVLASYGHVRDLPQARRLGPAGRGLQDHLRGAGRTSKKRIDDIAQAVKSRGHAA